MCQERETTDGEVAVVNRHDRPRILDTDISALPEDKPLRLKWMGPRAFQSRYRPQPGVDRDFGRWWGPRHDQRVSHRRDTLDSPTGLLYAYDLMWDEYAVLGTDLPWAAVNRDGRDLRPPVRQRVGPGQRCAGLPYRGRRKPRVCPKYVRGARSWIGSGPVIEDVNPR